MNSPKENLKYACRLGLCPRTTFVVPQNSGIVVINENSIREIFDNLRNRTIIRNFATWSPFGTKRGIIEAHNYIAKKQILPARHKKELLAKMSYHFEKKDGNKIMVLESFYFLASKIDQFMLGAAQVIALRNKANSIVAVCDLHEIDRLKNFGFEFDHSVEFDMPFVRLKKTNLQEFQFDTNYKRLHHQLHGMAYHENKKQETPALRE